VRWRAWGFAWRWLSARTTCPDKSGCTVSGLVDPSVCVTGGENDAVQLTEPGLALEELDGLDVLDVLAVAGDATPKTAINSVTMTPNADKRAPDDVGRRTGRVPSWVMEALPPQNRCVPGSAPVARSFSGLSARMMPLFCLACNPQNWVTASCECRHTLRETTASFVSMWRLCRRFTNQG